MMEFAGALAFCPRDAEEAAETETIPRHTMATEVTKAMLDPRFDDDGETCLVDLLGRWCCKGHEDMLYVAKRMNGRSYVVYVSPPSSFLPFP